MAILTTTGGASLKSGEMELMVHRRLLYDDFRGVGEPLNETACGCRDCACHGLVARGKHLISLHVRQSAKVYNDLLQFATPWQSFVRSSQSASAQPLLLKQVTA